VRQAYILNLYDPHPLPHYSAGYAGPQTPPKQKELQTPEGLKPLRTPNRSATRHQVRGGKIPINAMQKLSVRNGIKLLCGRLPPAMDVATGLMATSLALLGA
jgi:hypothetical protein